MLETWLKREAVKHWGKLNGADSHGPHIME